MREFLKMFGRHTEFIDDLRIRKLLSQVVFPNDTALLDAIATEEIERDQRTLETLIKTCLAWKTTCEKMVSR